NLARELVDEGLRDDAIPSLARLGELGQLADLPALIAELARQLEEPDSRELAARVRAHAQEREASGFAPRELVAELLRLRRASSAWSRTSFANGCVAPTWPAAWAATSSPSC